MTAPWSMEQANDLNKKVEVMGDRVMQKVNDLQTAVTANYNEHEQIRQGITQAMQEVQKGMKKAEDKMEDALMLVNDVRSEATDGMKKISDRIALMEQVIVNMQTDGTKLGNKVLEIETKVAAVSTEQRHPEPRQQVPTISGASSGTGKEFVDLKQMRPEKLKTAEEFRPWRASFENFCELVDQGVKEILRKIGNQRKALTDDEMKTMCGNMDKDELDRRLHNALVGYTEGEAKRLVESVGARQGLKAYQELCMYYDLKTDASENRLMSDLLGMASKPAKNLQEVRKLMIEMEARKTRLEEMGGEVPRPKSLRAILVGLLDEETRKHIGDTISGLDYNEAKKKVNDHVTTNLEARAGGSDDMDLGRCGTGEGTGKEDEEKKTENDQEEEGWEQRLATLKGQGKGCYNCGKMGHIAANCYSKGGGKGGKGGWQQQGKGGWPQQGKGGEGFQEGKGKSKGKGKGPRTGCFTCGGAHYASNCPQGKGKGKGKGIFPFQDASWDSWQENQWSTPLCCLRKRCEEEKGVTRKRSAFMRLAELEMNAVKYEDMIKEEAAMEKEDEEAMRDGHNTTDNSQGCQQSVGKAGEGEWIAQKNVRSKKKEKQAGKKKWDKEVSRRAAEAGVDNWQMEERMIKDLETCGIGLPDHLKSKMHHKDDDNGKVGVLRVEQDDGLNAMKQAGGWKKVRFTVDSGAGETVMNKDELPGIEVVPSAGSRRGQHYVTASDERIANEGEQKFIGRVSAWNMMENGQWTKTDEVSKGVKVQIADISHPLMAVKSLCLAKHRVIFDEDGSYAQHKQTGEVIEITEEKGEYVLEMWVFDGDQEKGFTRQGR